MKVYLKEEQMIEAVHILLQEDKKYKEQLISDLTEEEYKRFLKECPEFLEDE